MGDPGDVVYVHIKVFRNVHCIEFDRKGTHVKDELVGTYNERADPRVVLLDLPAPRLLLGLPVAVLLLARNLFVFCLASVIGKRNIGDLSWLDTYHVRALERSETRSNGNLICYFLEWIVL